MMTPERWSQIQQKLEVAMTLEPVRRAAYLEELGAADPDMRVQLESLLAQQSTDTNFLKTAAMDSLRQENSGRRDPMIGRRLGPYEVTDLLGVGGMGEVYRAFRADDQYKKQVAIKLVRAGQDSALVLSRFKNERQILASLDHPNIARLLDGGTTQEGVPYLVMELIEGQPIDDYCDAHKLDITARVQLFMKVCSAVQYAHSRLIVHRDLKPGNILVTTDGQPKLLDFGIAKILDPGGFGDGLETTMTVLRALTPGYASPEQVRGQTITTASDVYSLGVVLYELLTGQHPYGMTARSADAIAHAVLEFEPEKPSSVVRRSQVGARPDQAEIAPPAVSALREGVPDKLSRRLRGDLDNIVLMALRKEPERRYASVEQFAEDIRRHLENMPVIARKGTARYRAAKFFTRHKAGIAATAAVALVLLASLVVTLREARVARQQAEVARQQRARAERRFNDVRKLANSLMFDIHDSIRSLPGATPARKLLVSRALEYLDTLTPEASGDPTLQRELAAAYERVGDVLGSSDNPNMGDFTSASQSYAKALTILESLAASNPSDVNLQIGLAGEYFRVTEVLQDLGDFTDAKETMQRAEPLIQRMAASQDPRQQTYVAGLYYYTARVLERTGDTSGALQDYRQAASILEPIAAAPQANVFVQAYLPGNYDGIAKMLAVTGKIDEAVAMAAKAVDLIKRLSDANPTNATFRSYLGNAYGIAADVQERKGNLETALKLYRQGYEIQKELKSADPNNQQAVLNFGIGDLDVGEILVKQGKVSQGLESFREALATFRDTPGSKNLWVETELSNSYADLGMAYATLAERAGTPSERTRYWREARSWYQKGLDVWSEKANPTSGLDALGNDQRAKITQELAKCDAKLKEFGARAVVEKK
jgi:serine/threonine protein kinase/tetratricopeptide (TPR) repeat protein